MRLKTTLQINAVFPIALALLVALGMILRAVTITKARKGIASAEQIVNSVSDLSTATFQCFISTDVMARKKWNTIAEDLDQYLGGLSSDSGLESFLVEELREKLKDTRADFAAIVPLLNAAAVGGGTGGDRAKEILRLQDRLGKGLQSMVMLSFKLATTSHSSAVFHEELADTIFTVFVAVFGLLMSLYMVMLSKEILGRLQQLGQAAQAVTSGNLQVRVDVKDDGEIGEIYRAFNALLRKVQEDLEKANSEAHTLRKNMAGQDHVAAAARDGNMKLADALTRLKTAQGQIVQQERIKVLEQIAGGVARDFSAALSPAFLLTDMLLTNPDLVNNRKNWAEDLRMVHQSIQQTLRKIQVLSDLFQTCEQSEPEAVNVNHAVREAANSVRTRLAAEKATRYLFDLRLKEVPWARGKEIDLIDSVAHLMMNAVEAMPNGGQIHVETREEKGKVILRIADTGEGMSEDVHQRCLEPFFTTKGTGHHGMGLTFTLAAMGRYGGTVDISSVAGNGTSVVITLLRHSTGTVAAPVPEAELPSGNRKLLVVDDEPWVRDALQRGLTSIGFQVDLAANGTEGLAKGKAQRYDAVILDQAMPDMEGLEVAAGLREVYADLPILIISGMGELLADRDRQNSNVNLILSKPVTVADLRKALAKVWTK